MDARRSILEALACDRHGARFANELAVAARAAGAPDDGFDAALDALERAGAVVVVSHAAPDVHLAGVDLRTVAVIEDPSPAGVERARSAAERRWADYLRTFLASHRCG